MESLNYPEEFHPKLHGFFEVKEEKKMDMKLVFYTRQPEEGTETTHIVRVDLPDNLVRYCAERFLTMALQNRFRKTTNELDKITIGNQTVYLDHVTVDGKDSVDLLTKMKEVFNDKNRQVGE